MEHHEQQGPKKRPRSTKASGWFVSCDERSMQARRHEAVVIPSLRAPRNVRERLRTLGKRLRLVARTTRSPERACADSRAVFLEQVGSMDH